MDEDAPPAVDKEAAPVEAEEASKAAAAETAPAAEDNTPPLAAEAQAMWSGHMQAVQGMADLARLTPQEQDGRLVAMQEQWGVRFTAAQIDAIRAFWSDVRPLQP